MDSIEKPQLLFFISIDIVGSTQFKQKSLDSKSKQNDPVLQWVPFFLKFYKDLAEEIIKKYKYNDPNAPEIWKLLGDEIILYAPIKKSKDIITHLNNIIEATTEYNKGLENNLLGLKLTAWTAGFPVNNFIYLFDKIPKEKEVFLEKSYRQKDFIGPQIDTGFRLKEFATPQKMIISIELAYMLSKMDNKEIKLFYEGRKKLKGVDERGGYPCFWVEAIPDKIDKSEADIIYSKENKNKLYNELCTTYINDESNGLHLPFIEKDKIFGKNKPSKYNQKLEKAKKILSDNYKFEDVQELSNNNNEISKEQLKIKL